MADEQVQKLIQGAVNAVKNGDKPLARRAFLQALKLDPRHEGAWLGLATVAHDNREKLTALQKALQINPQSPRALEAIKRLGLTPEQLLGISPAETPESEPPSEPAFASNPEPSAPAVEPKFEVPEDAPPPVAKPLKALRQTTEVPAVTPVPEETPQTRFEKSAPMSALEPDSEPVTFVEEVVAKPATVIIPLEEAFARAPRPPQGNGGTPIPPQASLQQAAQQGVNALQEASKTDSPLSNITWIKKTSGRAGEREIRILQAQIIGGVLAFVLVFGGITAAFALNNPDVQRILFAPTWTLSPTPTFTATPTPGFTPTPSATPELTLTPSPTFPVGVATKDAIYYVPYPTEIYVPVGVLSERNIDLANQAMNNGQMPRAFTLLESERTGTEATGNFLPYAFLVEWHLREGDIVSARTVLIEGETRWQERSNDSRYQPLIDIAYAKVLLAETREALSNRASITSVTTALDDASARLDNALAQDSGRPIEAYVLKADRYLLEGNTDEALRIVTEALLNNASTLSNTQLRLKRAQIYYDLAQYDDTISELNVLLQIEPYAKDALRLQVLSAIGKRDYGLGVIFAEQYMARYSGSVEAVKLRGDAWLAEGKLTLALEQYERALTGDESDPAYFEVLMSRAILWTELGADDRAQADLTEALRLSDGAPRVRFARMNAALKAGNLTIAQTDAEQLVGWNGVPAGDHSLWL